jgi:hypothetical protein
MVDPYQLVLGLIALSIVVLAPIGFLLAFEALCGRWDHVLPHLRDRWSGAREHRRNVRALRHQHGIPLEQLVADLRRLRSAIACDEHRSAAHQMGNRMAYDRVLMQICAMLNVSHDLDGDSGGMERDIERFRVEAELERAGVVFSDGRRFGQAA